MRGPWPHAPAGSVNDDRINTQLSESEIDNMLDPANYLGCAPEMVDRVLSLIAKTN